MSESISPLRSQDNSSVIDSLQTRLRDMRASRQTHVPASSAVTVQVRPGPKMPDETEAAASVARMQTEAQRGVDVTAVHNGLDPQRVAKLLGLLE